MYLLPVSNISSVTHIFISTAITMPASPSTPVNLVSVNMAPERATKVIGEVIENVKDRYTIVHAGNSTTIEGVRPLLESVQPPPGILVSACGAGIRNGRVQRNEARCTTLSAWQDCPRFPSAAIPLTPVLRIDVDARAAGGNPAHCA